MKNKILILAIVAAMGLGGCASKTQVISKAESAEMVSASLSDNDFESAAKSMLESMLSSKKIGAKKSHYVMLLDEVQNDTMQRINTAELTDYIEEELTNNTDLITPTRAFGGGRNNNIAAARSLSDSELVKQSTVKKKNQVDAYDLILEGRITQKNTAVEGTSNKKIDYIFSLRLIDANDGLLIWSKKETITKLTDKKTQTW